ncbi:hypothetical protein B0H65DRAFT_443223 [Neurospora tetraspora]|uniref:Uncharacterized protein n=1 Tax=Neurospora tetraspora TaxID=94610 RepID=A0AAE0JBY6_9PEZI|nr:hypothetical protein B0H65DRAFT_443223 [Neurospora tetraspora]
MTYGYPTTAIADGARQMECPMRVLPDSPVDPDLFSSEPGSGDGSSSAASTYRCPVGWDPALIETSSTKRTQATKRGFFTPRGIRKGPEYNYEFVRDNSGHVAPAMALKDLPRRPFNPYTEPWGQYQVPYQPWSPGYSTPGGFERPRGYLGIPFRTAEEEAEDSSLKGEPFKSAGEAENKASAEKEGENTTTKQKQPPAMATSTVEVENTSSTPTSNSGGNFDDTITRARASLALSAILATAKINTTTETDSTRPADATGVTPWQRSTTPPCPQKKPIRKPEDDPREQAKTTIQHGFDHRRHEKTQACQKWKEELKDLGLDELKDVVNKEVEKLLGLTTLVDDVRKARLDHK